LTAHALVLWLLCGATMAIGMKMASLDTTLVVHAILAPVFAAAVSLVYFWRFPYTTPLETACFFLVFIGLVDFFVVALAINRSLGMFHSALGTWIPFLLIFGATYLTRVLVGCH